MPQREPTITLNIPQDVAVEMIAKAYGVPINCVRVLVVPSTELHGTQSHTAASFTLSIDMPADRVQIKEPGDAKALLQRAAVPHKERT